MNKNTDPRTDNIKTTMSEHFRQFEHEYRHDTDTNAEVVYEDNEVIVIADHTGHELNEWASDLNFDRTEFSKTMHTLAEQVCDYDWSVSDPVVFDKFE